MRQKHKGKMNAGIRITKRNPPRINLKDWALDAIDSDEVLKETLARAMLKAAAEAIELSFDTRYYT